MKCDNCNCEESITINKNIEWCQGCGKWFSSRKEDKK